MHAQGLSEDSGSLEEALGYAQRALEASETASGAEDPRTHDTRALVADLEARSKEAVQKPKAKGWMGRKR